MVAGTSQLSEASIENQDAFSAIDESLARGSPRQPRETPAVRDRLRIHKTIRGSLEIRSEKSSAVKDDGPSHRYSGEGRRASRNGRG